MNEHVKAYTYILIFSFIIIKHLLLELQINFITELTLTKKIYNWLKLSMYWTFVIFYITLYLMITQPYF